MTKTQRSRYDTFLQVRDFVGEQPTLFPKSSRGGEMLDRITAVIAEIERQEPARLKAVAEGYHTASTRVVLKRWMNDVAAISRDLARQGAPGIAPLTMPAAGNDVLLLNEAQRFLEAGAAFSHELVQRGLGEQWAVKFKEAIDAFATRRGEKRTGRRDAIAARARVAAAVKEGNAALRTLDSIVNIALRDNAVLLPIWQQCRRVAAVRGKPAPSVPAEVSVASEEAERERAS